MKEEESHPNKLKTKVLTGKVFIVPAKRPIRPGRKGGSHMELWIFFFLGGSDCRVGANPNDWDFGTLITPRLSWRKKASLAQPRTCFGPAPAAVGSASLGREPMGWTPGGGPQRA